MRERLDMEADVGDVTMSGFEASAAYRDHTVIKAAAERHGQPSGPWEAAGELSCERRHGNVQGAPQADPHPDGSAVVGRAASQSEQWRGPPAGPASIENSPRRIVSWPAVVHVWIKPFAFSCKCMHIYPYL